VNRVQDLRNKWLSIAEKYSADNDFSYRLWEEIESYYSASGRYYHTLGHIGKLLRLFEEYETRITDKDAVQFAIWYHDIIYVPGRGDNETQSAELAEKRLRELRVSEEKIKTVTQLIEATKTHRFSDGADNFDGRFFLDSDLSILGANWEEYKEYAEQVRKEFSHVPEMAYRLGRSGVMKNFLNRESIYLTDALYERFEKKARRNIERELKLPGI
jgi:predicted metal-dependent HD superfamily phosphohydrolase